MKTPKLDLKYLARVGFEPKDGEFSHQIGTVEIRVENETGEGVLITESSQTPVRFITVTHLKWFMDAFK